MRVHGATTPVHDVASPRTEDGTESLLKCCWHLLILRSFGSTIARKLSESDATRCPFPALCCPLALVSSLHRFPVLRAPACCVEPLERTVANCTSCQPSLLDEPSTRPSSVSPLRRVCGCVDRSIASRPQMPPSWTVLETVTAGGKARTDGPPRCGARRPRKDPRSSSVSVRNSCERAWHPSQRTVCYSFDNQEPCDAVRHASDGVIDGAG